MSEEEIFTGFSAGSMYNDPQFLEGRQTNMPSFDITYNNIIAFLAADVTIK